MTQTEKLQMVEGGVTPNQTYGYTVPRGAGGWVAGNARLNIPALYFADGSVGVGNAVDPATALPTMLGAGCPGSIVRAESNYMASGAKVQYFDGSNASSAAAWLHPRRWRLSL
jgi:CubicO group peptidase (beta-lactamase class C family)